MSSNTIVDLSITADLEQDLLEEIFESYVRGGNASLQRVNDGLTNNDLSEISFGAHKLKGSSIGVGAKSIAKLAALIEQQAEEGNNELLTQVKELNQQFEEIKSFLKEKSFIKEA